MQNLGFEIFDILISAQLTSSAIYIVAKLRLADYLKDGPKSVEDLAEKTKTHPDSLYRLLRMLSSIGIFAETIKEGEEQQQVDHSIRQFELTPMASLIQSDAKNSISNFALMFGLESFKNAIDDLLYSIQTGENSFKHANGLDMYEYLNRNQKEGQIFNNAMASLTSSVTPLISDMYDFSQFNTIIDIGGGQGVLLSSILKDNPKLYGVLFDLPYAIQSAKEHYGGQSANSNEKIKQDISSRCKLVEGDFFKSIPTTAADGYIIKNVILNWDDQSAAIILKNCLQAMNDGSSAIGSENQTNRKNTTHKLLIIDTIMPEGNEPFIGKFTDIFMLALTHKGRIRTEEEFRKLLSSSGFEITGIIRSHDPSNPFSIIEAIPSKSRSLE
ncbi:MAG TPA: methyltransferase [Nitrososphaeraceae archaeon]